MNCGVIASLLKKLSVQEVKFNEDGSKYKVYKFDPFKIKPEMIYDLVMGNKYAGKENVFKTIAKMIDNANVLKTMSKAYLLGDYAENNPLTKNLPDNEVEAGDILISRSIAMKHIISSMKSETDEMNNKNLDKNEEQNLKENGQRKIKLAGLMQTIGREIALRNRTAVKGDQNTVLAFYSELGRLALSDLEQRAGIITIDNGQIINNKFQEDALKPISMKQQLLSDHGIVYINFDQLGIDMNNADQVYEISDMFDRGVDFGLSENSHVTEELKALSDTSKLVYRMSIPSLLAKTMTEADEHVQVRETNTTPAMIKTLQELQSKPLIVDPLITPIFEYIGIEMEERMRMNPEKGDYSFIDIARGFPGITEDQLTAIFGDIESDYNEANRDSALGQSLSKTMTMQTMASLYKDYFGEEAPEQYWTNDMYRTGRVGLVQQILNAQIDKFFSRQVVTSEKVTIDVNSAEYIQLVYAINDDTKLDIDIIQDPRSDKAMNELLNAFEDMILNNDTDLKRKAEDFVKFLSYLSGNKIVGMDGKVYKIPMNKGDVWAQYRAVKSLHDIASRADGAIETDYQSKPDASGSGIIIQLMLALGFSKTIKEAISLLENLGYSKNGKKTLKDVYDIMLSRMKDDTRLSEDDVANKEQVNALEGFNFVDDLRELAKMPSMITAYLAGKASVQSESAKAYLIQIKDAIKKNKIDMNKKMTYRNLNGETVEINAFNFMKQLAYEGIGKTRTREEAAIVKQIQDARSFKGLMDINGIEPYIKTALEQKSGKYGHSLITQELTSKIMDPMQRELMPIYNEYVNLLRDNDKAMKEGTEKNQLLIKTLPAMVVVDMLEDTEDGRALKAEHDKDPSAFTEHYGINIMSKVNVLHDNDTVSKVEAPNFLTSIVNVVHSVDSAIQFLAHRRTMERIAKELSALERSGKNIRRRTQLRHAQKWGSSHVHDANNANVVYNTIFQQEYRKAIVYVASVYDIKEQLINSYNSVGSKLAKNNSEAYGSFTEINDDGRAERLDAKKEAISDLLTDNEISFGFEETLDAAPETLTVVPKNETKQKEETKEKTEETKEEKVEVKTEKEIAESNKALYNALGIESEIREKVIDIIKTSKNKIFEKFRSIPGFSDILEDDTTWAYKPDTNNITMGLEPYPGLTLEETIAHEVVHFSTLAYLMNNNPTNAVKYVNNALTIIEGNKKGMSKIKGLLSEHAAGRFQYIFDQATDVDRNAEFVAVMTAEPNTAEEIYLAIAEAQNKGITARFKASIKKIVNDIYNYIGKISSSDVKNLDDSGSIEVDILAKATNAILNSGEKFNENSPKKAKANRSKHKGNLQAGLEVPQNQEAMDMIYEASKFAPVMKEKDVPIPVYNYIADMLDKNGAHLLNVIAHSEKMNWVGTQIVDGDKYLKDNFPIYYDNMYRLTNVMEQSDTVQQLFTFLLDARVGTVEFMNRLNAIGVNTKARSNEIDTVFIKRMNDEMDKANLSDTDRSSIFWNVAQAPMFNLIESGDINRLINGEIDIGSLITEYENKMRNNVRVDQAKRTADMLTSETYEERKGDGYNAEQYNIATADLATFKGLVSLYAMDNTGTADRTIEILRDNDRLRSLLFDASLGLKQIHDRIRKNGREPARWRENIVRDVFSEQLDVRPATFEDLKNGRFKVKEGWKILRKPSAHKPGIVYRADKEATFQHGPGTSISYNNSDVLLNRLEFESFTENTVKTSYGRMDSKYKLILSPKEKRTLGLIENPADALYRSYSRFQEIEDTQIVRDALIMDGFTERVNSKKELKELDEYLNGIDAEYRTWQVKLPSGISVDDVFTKKDGKYEYPNIQKYYSEPDKKSSVQGFNNKFDLVRTDMIPILSGYKDPVMFRDNPPLRKTAYAVRGLVKMAKIVWTALSPEKIMNDTISNTAVLAGYGVGPVAMFKYGKEAFKYSKEFQDLRLEQLEYIMTGNKSEQERLQKEIEAHPYAFMQQNGLLSSLKIDIFTRDQSVVTGIQNDINNIIDKLTKNEKTGDLNSPAKLIQQFARWGYGIDDLLQFVGGGAQNVKFLESMGKRLNDAGKNISDMKSQEDITEFMAEILFTPGSQAVQFGSYLVHIVDQVGRYTLVKDLINKGMEPEKAFDMARIAFIDYNKDLPANLKMLSDYGILLFPSFWLRTPRVMAQMLSRKPISVATGTAVMAALDLHISNISDPMVNMLSGSRDVVNAPPLFDGLEHPALSTAWSLL